MTCTPNKQILWICLLWICLLQLGHFHVAGWILNYWPTWRSSRLASRAGRNDTQLEELWCKGYSCRAIFGQNTCRKWKTPGKNTETIWPVKKASLSNWLIFLLFFKWRKQYFWKSQRVPENKTKQYLSSTSFGNWLGGDTLWGREKPHNRWNWVDCLLYGQGWRWLAQGQH